MIYKTVLLTFYMAVAYIGYLFGWYESQEARTFFLMFSVAVFLVAIFTKEK